MIPKKEATHRMDALKPGERFGAGWEVDTIHCTPHDRLVFQTSWRGGYGLYVMQMGTRVTAGKFEEAQPHIGDAVFTRLWENEYTSVPDASAASWYLTQLLDVGDSNPMAALGAIGGRLVPPGPPATALGATS